jgi:DNA-binding LytR/AlgR family response regulator
VEAARQIDRRAHIVFVTAFDQYAVQAFAEGALDYLVKPVEAARLADTVARLQERLRAAQPAALTETMLQQLAAWLQQPSGPAKLRWIRASVGQAVRLIAVDGIDFLRSDEKYTLVAWRNEKGEPSEALVRVPLKELLEQLPPEQFVQVHRSVVVNMQSISQIKRAENETADIQLKGRPEVLPVSRSYLHLFRQM